MSPDIEWRVDDDSGQRVLATPTPPPWRRITLTLAFVLVLIGFGLGIIYSMVGQMPAAPTPSPLPTNTLRPTPTLPPSLAEVVARDSRALARREVVIASTELQSVDVRKWYQALLDANNWAYQLDTIVASGTLPTGATWVDLQEYRSDCLSRHTRFYRLVDGAWVWIPPDQTYWRGEQQTLSFDQTLVGFPMKAFFPAEDRPLIGETTARFVEVYRNLCTDLNCPRTSAVTVTLMIDPQLTRHRVSEQGRELTITLSSPHVLGLYDSYYGDVADPIRSIAYDSLIEPLVCLSSGIVDCWSSTEDGQRFVQAIAAWQRQRVKTIYDPQQFFFVGHHDPSSMLPPSDGHVSIQRFYSNLLADSPLLPLPALWSPSVSQTSKSMLFMTQAEVMATVAFIDQKHGALAQVKFLHALGTADSLPQAVANGLGLPYAEFERQWREWLSR